VKGDKDNDHQRKKMDVEEFEIEGLHPVEDLEIKEPEHAENKERADKINHRIERVSEIMGK